MSPQWLERLNQATEYRELNVVFSEIAADARAAPHDVELAKTIDQAIGRIQQESLRDEQQLKNAEEEYQTFKKQQSGLLGWLRRHLPFTETRRQEKRHNQTVADRRAEVLADQLIISRAQMIKEQLLPPDSRRMGHRESDWQSLLNECDSPTKLQDLASLARQLGDELKRSHAFIDQLEVNLDTFAKASFSNLEDQRRKNTDLTAARNELSVLKSEIQTEETIRVETVRRLGEFVSTELTTHDGDYRELVQRIGLLDTASRCAKGAEESFEVLQSTIRSMGTAASEFESIPEQRDKLVQQSRNLQRDAEDADRRRANAAVALAEPEKRYYDARNKAQQARAGVEAAKHVYDAYLVESGHAELPSDDTSPVAAELARQKVALSSAESIHDMVAATYNAAKAELQLAERQCAEFQKKLADTRHAEDSLDQRREQLRAELNSAHDQLRRAAERADKNAKEYLQSLHPLGHHDSIRAFERLMPMGHWGSTGLVPASQRTPDLKAFEELYSLVLKHLKDVRNSLDREFSADNKQRQSTWNRRCSELLGDDLAAEICKINS